MLRLYVAYGVFVEAVLTFGSVCWPCSATAAQKKTLRKNVTAASKLRGIDLSSLGDIYQSRSHNKAEEMLSEAAAWASLPDPLEKKQVNTVFYSSK